MLSDASASGSTDSAGTSSIKRVPENRADRERIRAAIIAKVASLDESRGLAKREIEIHAVPQIAVSANFQVPEVAGRIPILEGIVDMQTALDRGALPDRRAEGAQNPHTRQRVGIPQITNHIRYAGQTTNDQDEQVFAPSDSLAQ